MHGVGAWHGAWCGAPVWGRGLHVYTTWVGGLYVYTTWIGEVGLGGYGRSGLSGVGQGGKSTAQLSGQRQPHFNPTNSSPIRTT